MRALRRGRGAREEKDRDEGEGKVEVSSVWRAESHCGCVVR